MQIVFAPAAVPQANFHQCSHDLTTISSVVCCCHISGIYSKQAKRLQLAQITRSDGNPASGLQLGLLGPPREGKLHMNVSLQLIWSVVAMQQ